LKTVYDAARIIDDKRTINDEIISNISDEDCKTRNLFENKEYCKK
jgi:hypothetical protein